MISIIHITQLIFVTLSLSFKQNTLSLQPLFSLPLLILQLSLPVLHQCLQLADLDARVLGRSHLEPGGVGHPLGVVLPVTDAVVLDGVRQLVAAVPGHQGLRIKEIFKGFLYS